VFILLRVVVNVVINVVIVFIAVVITIIAFFVIKAVIKAFRLIFFTTRIIFTEQLLRSAWERHHYYRSRRTLREKKNKRGKGVSRLFNNI
jgi:hypothetical protein